MVSTAEVPGTGVPRGVADVAVVIPVHNRAGMLERALRSVDAQTMRPAEVVVVDDRSTDDSAEVALAHGATLVRMSENGGSGRARNAGIAAATATWVAFLDSDDEWLPGHVEQMMAAADGEALVTAPSVTTAGRVMGNPWRRPLRLSPKRLLVPGNVITTSGTMVRRRHLDQVGGFRPMRQAEDLDLWLRVLESGPGVALGRPTVRYHLHGSQVSSDREDMRRGFDKVMSLHAEKRWLTRSVQQGAYARVNWDEFRAELADGEKTEAMRHLASILTRPRTWWPVMSLVAARRASRYPTDVSR